MPTVRRALIFAVTGRQFADQRATLPRGAFPARLKRRGGTAGANFTGPDRVMGPMPGK